MPNVASIAAVASTPRHNAGSTSAVRNHYGATAQRPASRSDDAYQSFCALPDDVSFSTTPSSPQCALTLPPGPRQVVPSFLCLGGAALCLAAASYELTSALLHEQKPAPTVAPFIAVAVGLNVAALFAARKIGAPIPEPENIVD